MSVTEGAVFKIMTEEQWEELCDLGVWSGSEDDQADGYIHLAFSHQVADVLKKHFSDAGALIIAELHESDLGEDLKVEAIQGGAQYPHLYRPISLGEVLRDFELEGPSSPLPAEVG
ncbi:MAG: DUF952 domain-containing protein [Polyangiaceae bacterium]|nr:DUF952 domain-containing protein [Polyangiaceae bacterium]